MHKGSCPSRLSSACLSGQFPLRRKSMEKDEIKKGAFLIARKIFNSNIWLNKPASWKIIWIFILGSVNHKDVPPFKKGEGFFNFASLKRQIGIDITEDQIKKCLHSLRHSSMVSTKRSTRGTYIKVLNYELYQTLDNYKAPQEAPQEAREKHERSTPINKYEKNEKYREREKQPQNTTVVSSEAPQEPDTSPRPPTPSDLASSFFSKGEYFQQCLADFSKGRDPSPVAKEIDNFILYWTESNKSGTKQRWQLQETFDVKRRLYTWLSRSKDFGNNYKSKPKEPIFI